MRCGSAGTVTVEYESSLACGRETKADQKTRSLRNIADHPQKSPFFVHLPPFPSADAVPTPLPRFLADKPVASINYRWVALEGVADAVTSRWPRPIHDTLFAYSWLVENLAPEGLQRRDIYVYGSHLGGSLATALSLTEAHPHMRFAVRGVISYNGVYNWTMFLPDHAINRPYKRTKNPAPRRRQQVEDSHLYRLQELLPAFFRAPVDMFDPFASPSLFFHNPGLAVPEASYVMTAEETAALLALADPEAAAAAQHARVAAHKSHLVFPPRASTQKIPEALLLYDSPVAAPSKTGRRTVASGRGNTMENQARELAELMRRSVDKVELKERRRWDEDVDLWQGEAERRVQLCEVGDERSSLELNPVGEAAVEEWLAKRLAGGSRTARSRMHEQ